MFQSLSVRLLALLTIALLPLGSIAVYQTLSVVSEADRFQHRDALSRTEMAAQAQVELINLAQGTARAIGNVALEVGTKTTTCDDVMARIVEQERRFAFAGFIGADGIMRCNSTGNTIDFSGSEDWAETLRDPKPTVTTNRSGAATGLSVMIASVPLIDDDDNLLGVAAISIPHSLTDLLFDDEAGAFTAAIVDRDGEVLSASTGIETASEFQSLGIVPRDLAIPPSGMTITVDTGEDFETIAIVPLISRSTYVIGRPGPKVEEAQLNLFDYATPAFPVLMWLASLFVAFFALEHLVLRHLKQLRRKMTRFSMDKLSQSYVTPKNAPSDIVEIADSYNTLIDRIAANHTKLEANVREKEVLLKEIHHRVKNNLQLISSILNMQLRQITQPRAKYILQRIQDRVMSLATIHKLLYSDTDLEVVRADRLLSEILSSVINVGTLATSDIEQRISLAQVELDPDQAVPLSLLVTEAVTNALKYAGAAEGTKSYIALTLSEETEGQVELVIQNSKGQPDPKAEEDLEEGGLGTRLIQAFVTQLGGTAEVDNHDTAYTLTVRFEKLEDIADRAATD